MTLVGAYAAVKEVVQAIQNQSPGALIASIAIKPASADRSLSSEVEASVSIRTWSLAKTDTLTTGEHAQ